MPLLLYPGFHKTGSTTVQTRVLPKLEARYLGRHYGSEHRFEPELAGEIGGLLALAARGEPCRDPLADLIVRLASRRERVVLASEILLCPAGAQEVLDAVAEAARCLDDPGALAVLVTLRRQSELVLSRYLHDLNTKLPALAASTLRGRVAGWLGSRRLPYPLEAAIDPANPPCAWPMCLPRGADCACLARGRRVSITLPLYDFAHTRAALSAALPEERVAFADLTDPALRPRGAERVAALLRGFGESSSAQQIEAACAEPLNTWQERSRRRAWRRDFSREDLGAAALDRIRARLDAHYRASNEALAAALPEFASWLEPFA